jgi:uncharacterized phage protein gp47/JayE
LRLSQRQLTNISTAKGGNTEYTGISQPLRCKGAAAPAAGERFFTDGLYFTLKQDEKQSLYLEAETFGTASNNIISGTPAVPMNNISGLAVSQFGVLIEPGADTESDDNYRERIREKISGPAENGNRQHYKTWCESVDGVGRARIIPLFAGENTVMAVIITPDGLPAADTLLERVQEYIDPITLGLTVEADGETIPVGDGLGDGQANIGAHFAAVAPEIVRVDISFAAELKTGVTPEQIKELAVPALAEYIRTLTLTTPEKQNAVIRISAISAILYDLPGLTDYSGLTVNGETSNTELSVRQVGVLGEVTVSASV